VLLSFHPLAWTPVCTDQMKTLSSPWGSASTASRARPARAEHLGIKRTRRLADFWPHGSLAIALRLFREKHGFSERATIILNKDQRAAFVKVHLPMVPDVEEILTFLKAM